MHQPLATQEPEEFLDECSIGRSEAQLRAYDVACVLVDVGLATGGFDAFQLSSGELADMAIHRILHRPELVYLHSREDRAWWGISRR